MQHSGQIVEQLKISCDFVYILNFGVEMLTFTTTVEWLTYALPSLSYSLLSFWQSMSSYMYKNVSA